MPKKKFNDLEDNGYYWIKVVGHEPEIGRYTKDRGGFNIFFSNMVFSLNICEVISRIILRENENIY